MAFDGLVTCAAAAELSRTLTLGKIEKIYQPESDLLIFNIHTREGNRKLLLSCASSHAGVYMTDGSYENPAQPLAFCMLMRKHLQGGRLQRIAQKQTERIIEFDIETMNELGFSVNKRLIVEIMGKHSNIVLTDIESGKIIDCIKRVSIDVNRVRQLLPGKLYEYPPAQDKQPFFEVGGSDVRAMLDGLVPSDESGGLRSDALSKQLLSRIQGISPAVADTLAAAGSIDAVCTKLAELQSLLRQDGSADAASRLSPAVYLDASGSPCEFHVFPLAAFEGTFGKKTFDSVSEMLDFYFKNKTNSNRVRQKTGDLERAVKACLDKLYLKRQRLSEDILKAENSENYRLYGELITANLHKIKPGADKAILLNYYDGQEISIPLDARFSAAKNAQNYFKKYGKSKTAIKEKAVQLEDTNADIEYLESTLVFAENAESVEQTEAIREELIESGFLRRRKNSFAVKKLKQKPLEFKTSDGYRVLVGKNNKENDVLTFKTAGSKDIWFHTKDIPGSHVILFTDGTPLDELSEAAVFEAAAIAAYHSKGRDSENVPVDYVQVRHVKKPNGAKPGMVIFTNNRTVWVNPTVPK